MKPITMRTFGLILLSTCIISCASKKNTPGTALSEKQIDRWFAEKSWASGLKIVPFADINKREFYLQYHKHPQWWDKVFVFMRDNDLSKVANGKTLIDGDSVFVTVTESPDKEFDKTAWESHRKFIDLQYVAAGQERILVANPASLTLTKPYDDAKDVMNYTGEGKSYVAVPGTFYLFFPTDAHRPSIKVDDAVVKKVTFKIRYSK